MGLRSAATPAAEPPDFRHLRTGALMDPDLFKYLGRWILATVVLATLVGIGIIYMLGID